MSDMSAPPWISLRRLVRRQSGPVAAVAVAIVALAARLLHLWEAYGSDPFFRAPVVDALTYLDWARRIAGGDLLGDQVFWQPPLFPYLLGAVVALSGEHTFVVIRLVHALLGSAACVILFRLARRILPLRAALGAALAMALYGPLLHFENTLLSVALEVFLDLLLVDLCTRALQGPPSKGTLVRLTAAGAIAGLAALTRPNILLFAAAFGLWLIQRQRPAWRQGLGAAAAFALGTTLVVAPVTARNWAIGGSPVPISANGGVNFFIGNNAAYDSTVAIHPGVRWEQLVGEPAAAGATTAAQRSDYFYAKSAAWAGAHPLDFSALLLRKTWLFLAGPEWKRNLDVYAARAHSRLLAALMWDHGLSFPFGLLAPLALVGLALTWRHRGTPLALLRLYAVSYSVSVILFFIAARYRLPVVPAFLVFAAIAVRDLARAAAVRRWRRLLAAGGSALGLTVILNLPAAPPYQQDAQYWANLGEARLRLGQPAEALTALERALGLEPDYPNAEHNAAAALLDLGRADAARRHALAALQGQPGRPDTRVLLARAETALGDTVEALQQLRLAVGTAPDLASARFELGRLLRQQGKPRAAVEQLRIAARLEPGDYLGAFELGRALAATGDAAEARTAFEAAMALAPARDEAPVAAAAMCILLGDLDAGRRLLSSVLARSPNQPEALLNLGLLELRAGAPKAAVQHFERLQALRPADRRADLLLRQAQARAGRRQVAGRRQ